MDEPATEDLRAVKLFPLLLRAVGRPIPQLSPWYAAGGHRRDLTRSGHDAFTPAIELMDAWWPKLLEAEFRPMLGSGGFGAVQSMLGFGGTDFAEGWYGYVSKDLRRLFGSERGRYSHIYCGNLPGRKFSLPTLRRRCRAALRSALSSATTVPARQLYGTTCPGDPEPACSDQNRFTYASAIHIPAFPYQNRPTFQQVVTLSQHLGR
jgi:hypothetical protein